MGSKELSWEECARWVRARQKEGGRVVFTNGCFDLLHAGHIHLLQEACSLGDHLVVGVNSDPSVQRLKGPRRPLMPLEDRLQILGALTAVEVLVVFPHAAAQTGGSDPRMVDTPYDLLRKIRPDVLVKGGDYTPDEVVGREFVGEVKIIPLLDGRSSSELSRRLDGISPAEVSVPE